MASPARKPSTGTDHRDEALGILRRLETVLARITDDLGEVKAEQRRQADVQRKQGEDIAELKGRLGELSARIPTTWTIASLIFAIFGASFVLIRFASGH